MGPSQDLVGDDDGDQVEIVVTEGSADGRKSMKAGARRRCPVLAQRNPKSC